MIIVDIVNNKHIMIFEKKIHWYMYKYLEKSICKYILLFYC